MSEGGDTDSGCEEVQGNGGGRHRQENDASRGEGVTDVKARKHCAIEGGVQEVDELSVRKGRLYLVFEFVEKNML